MIRIPALGDIEWLSPLVEDDFAEYRDASFLRRLGLAHLSDALAGFWPRRGPQWDALGRAGEAVVLVEAKAHVSEFLSPSSQAGVVSRAKIDAAFAQVKAGLGITSDADWAGPLYQYTNRIAHLWWLRMHGIDAHLLFVDFLHDDDMGGPHHAETWAAAYSTASFVLGMPTRHPIFRWVHHVTPDVRALQ